MIIRYLINKLDKEEPVKVLAVLQHIKKMLKLSEPSNSIWASLDPRDYSVKISSVEIVTVLEDLERKRILKILKTNGLSQNLNAKPVRVIRKMLDSEYEKVEDRIKELDIKESPRKGVSINKIICVRPGTKSNKFKIVLNDDYQNWIQGDVAKPSWKLLFDVAEEKKVWYEQKHKNSLDYFNSNKHNRLYTQSGCNLTKILKKEGEFIRPGVEIEAISEKAFQTRLRKFRKS